MNLAAFVDVSVSPPEAIALVSWFLAQDVTGETPPRVRAAVEAVAAGLERWAETPELPLAAAPEKLKRKRGRPRKEASEDKLHRRAAQHAPHDQSVPASECALCGALDGAAAWTELEKRGAT